MRSKEKLPKLTQILKTTFRVERAEARPQRTWKERSGKAEVRSSPKA
jgi:hypothetical protein